MSNHKAVMFDVQGAVDWLKAGKILAYPSESVWGLGIDGYCQTAVMALLDLKQRDVKKGLIVLVDNTERLLPLITHLPKSTQMAIIQRLNDQQVHQSQAQTWVIPVRGVPFWLTGGRDALAVRVSPHQLLRQLCQALITPNNPYGFLVSTSCNPSGQSPAKNLAQAQSYFAQAHQVGYLAGETLGFDKPSCICDVMTGQILRG